MEVVGGRSLEGEEGGREGREVRALLGSAAAVDVVALVETKNSFGFLTTSSTDADTVREAFK